MISRLVFLFFFISTLNFAQTYKFAGGKLLGWELANNAESFPDHVKLTSDNRFLVGAVFLQADLRGYLPNLKLCHSWKVNFDFRIDGKGSVLDGFGDGFAFWHMLKLPSDGELIQDLGITEEGYGLMIGFDIYDEKTNSPTNKIHILYGENTGNIEDNPNAFHSVDFSDRINFRGLNYKHVRIEGERAGKERKGWRIKIFINDDLYVDEVIDPVGKAEAMNRGSFGFSASTKNPTSRHSITNVEIFVDKVFTIASTIEPDIICPDPLTGTTLVDLTQYESRIVENPNEVEFMYFDITNDRFITNPKSFEMSSTSQRIKVIVLDPSRKLCDSEAIIKLSTTKIPKKDTTLFGCGNEIETFDLTLAAVSDLENKTVEYYEKLEDVYSGKNMIENPQSYKASTSSVLYAKIIDSTTKCYGIAEITLVYTNSDLNVNSSSLESCMTNTSLKEGVFNLNTASVSSTLGVSIEYFVSRTDALFGRNAIVNTKSYSSSNKKIFAKVTNATGCYKIAELSLVVIEPLNSAELKINGQSAEISVKGGKAPYYYSLDGKTWQSSPHFENIHQVNNDFFFIKDSSNCDMISIAKPALKLYNYFSPNGDGHNDVFDYSFLKNKTNLIFKIYNRQGQLVYQKMDHDLSYSWDGKKNGRLLPTSTYFYIATWTSENGATMHKKGWVYLKNR